MRKKTIGVLFGGCSSEYGVSLQSAYAVIKHVDRKAFNPVLIGITQAGQWLQFDGSIEKIADDSWYADPSCVPAIIPPCRSVHGLLDIASHKQTWLDAVFPVLHGRNGEDGTVQGLLELAGIPVIGCGSLASALCMDKYRAHQIVRAIGMLTPNAFVLQKNQDASVARQYADMLGYPLFVKPVRAGSSIGITKAKSPDSLSPAVSTAFQHDDQVILEQAINGCEVGCAVLGDEQLIIGQLDEIELTDGFFDFTEKYNLITSQIHMPAPIDRIKAEEIKRKARAIYKALDCSGFARVDMFLTPDGQIYFNEVNTIPGFTAHSRFPSMLRGIGLSFGEVVNRIIRDGLTS